MKQDYQHTFLEFLIAENKELKAFIKSVVEKSLNIDKPVITSGYMGPITDFDAKKYYSPTIQDYGKNNFKENFGMKEAMGKARSASGFMSPISAIDIAKERIEKIPAETPEEKAEKEQALKEMNNIFGLD